MGIRRIIALIVCSFLVVPGAESASATHKERVVKWSGYRWTVRYSRTPDTPLGNLWGDSSANVRVRRDGKLRLNIVHGRAVELVGPRTTYGRYKWVVETDMGTADPFRVVAFFVRGTRGEQDIEFSRWATPTTRWPGTWVSWRGERTRAGWAPFFVTPMPPYVVRIEWGLTSIRFVVLDGLGAVLLDTKSAFVPAGRHVSPRISYWLYPGNAILKSPYTRDTVHPPVIIRSFKFTRRGKR